MLTRPTRARLAIGLAVILTLATTALERTSAADPTSGKPTLPPATVAPATSASASAPALTAAAATAPGYLSDIVVLSAGDPATAGVMSRPLVASSTSMVQTALWLKGDVVDTSAAGVVDRYPVETNVSAAGSIAVTAADAAAGATVRLSLSEHAHSTTWGSSASGPGYTTTYPSYSGLAADLALTPDLQGFSVTIAAESTASAEGAEAYDNYGYPLYGDFGARFPATPIGVGAQWTARQYLYNETHTLIVPVTWTLASFDGSRFALQGSATIDLASIENLPTAGNGTGNVGTLTVAINADGSSTNGLDYHDKIEMTGSFSYTADDGTRLDETITNIRELWLSPA